MIVSEVEDPKFEDDETADCLKDIGGKSGGLIREPEGFWSEDRPLELCFGPY